MKKTFYFLSVLVLLISGCSHNTAGPTIAGGATDTEVAFTGTVYQANSGQPAPSVTIKLFRNYEPLAKINTPLLVTKSDVNGHYSFEGLLKGEALTVVGTDMSDNNAFFGQETLSATLVRSDTLSPLGHLEINMDTLSLHQDSNYLIVNESLRRIPLDTNAVRALDTLSNLPYQVRITIVFGDSIFRDTVVSSVRLVRWALIGMVYEYLGYLVGPSQPGTEVNDPLLGRMVYENVPFGATVFQCGDTIFFLGGQDDRMNTSNRAVLYLLSSQEWLTASPLQVALETPGVGRTNSAIMVFGGFYYEGDRGTLQQYDPPSMGFNFIGEIPDTMVGFDGTNPRLYASCMGKIYSVSTSKQGNGFSVFESMDGKQWKRFDKLNISRPFGLKVTSGQGIRNPTVLQVGATVNFIGGRDADNNPVTRVASFDLGTQEWKSPANLTMAIENPAALAFRGTLYTFEELENGATIVETFDPSDNLWRFRGFVSDTVTGFTGQDPNFMTVCNGRIYAVSNGGNKLTIYESSDGVNWIAHVSSFGSSYQPVVTASDSRLYIVAGNVDSAPNKFYEFNTFTNEFRELPRHTIVQDAKYTTCWYSDYMVYKINSCVDGIKRLEIYDIRGNNWMSIEIPPEIMFINNRRYSVIQPDSTKPEVYLFSPQALDQGFYFNYKTFAFTGIVHEPACQNPVIVASDSLLFILSTGDMRRPDLFCSFDPVARSFVDRKLPTVRRSGQFNAISSLNGSIIRINSSALGPNSLEIYTIPDNRWTSYSAPTNIDFTNDGFYSILTLNNTDGKLYLFENDFRIPGVFFNCSTKTFSTTK